MKDFIHLHTHSHFSFRDGLNSPDQIIQKAIDLKQKGIAITDHGNMCAWSEMHSFCKDKDIRPIYGIEFYVTKDKNTRIKNEKRNHLLMLAKNYDGLRMLFKLLYESHKYFYSRPRIDWELIKSFRDELVGNVIVSTACIAGELQQHCLNNNKEDAIKFVKRYKKLFGDDFYIELQFNEIADQNKSNKRLLKFAKKFDIKPIITVDSHYVDKEDYITHRNLLYLQSGIKKTTGDISDKDKKSSELLWEFDAKQLYIKSRSEVFNSSEQYGSDNSDNVLNELCDNTVEIFEKIKDIEYDCTNKLIVPVGFEDKDEDERFNFLKKQSFIGLEKRSKSIKDYDEERYKKQLEYELIVIKDKKIYDYFLSVFDLVKQVKKRGILVGVGRGSAAGCLVSYCLGITQIDPIRFGLYFERFLNPGRNELPDIDIDFSDNNFVKDFMFEYFNKKNEDGEIVNTSVALVSNYGTFQFKGVFRDVCRIYNIDIGLVNSIAKDVKTAFDVWIKKEENTRDDKHNIYFADAIECCDSFREFIEKPENEELAITMKKLTGKIKHIGKHASGIIVYPNIYETCATYAPRGDLMQLQLSPQEGGYARGLTAIGHVKYDILGLKTLRIIDDVLKLISNGDKKIYRKYYLKIHPDIVDINDIKVYKKIFWKDFMVAVFQFEGHGIRKVIQQMLPDKFEDIAAINALYRPGPIYGGVVDTFINNYNNPKDIEYPHEKLKPVLEKTFGVLIYQEQVMEIANVIGGLSLEETDKLRKILGKYDARSLARMKQIKPDDYRKHFENLDNMKKVVFKGFEEHDIDKKKSKIIWDFMQKFSLYGFNRAHSVSYAMVAFQSAWLKCYKTLEFYCAVLINSKFEDFKTIINEFLKYNNKFSISKPDLTKSHSNFSIIDKSIIFGFENVKGIGDKAAFELNTNRPYNTINDFFNMDSKISWRRVTIKIIEIMIEAGLFDSFGYTYKEIYGAYLLWGMRKSKATKKQKENIKVFDYYINKYNEEGLPDNKIITEQRRHKLKIFEHYGQDNLIETESRLFGYNFSNPFIAFLGEDKYNKISKKYDLTDEIILEETDDKYIVLYRVIEIRKTNDKRGNQMAFVKIELFNGNQYDLTIFSSLWSALDDIFKKNGFYISRVNVNEYNGNYSLLLDNNYKTRLIKK